MLKWEESKRWQTRVEKLRTKLQAKTREVEENEKMIARLKDRVNRSIDLSVLCWMIHLSRFRLEQEKLYQESKGSLSVEKSSTIITMKRMDTSDSIDTPEEWLREKQSLLRTVCTFLIFVISFLIPTHFR